MSLITYCSPLGNLASFALASVFIWRPLDNGVTFVYDVGNPATTPMGNAGETAHSLCQSSCYADMASGRECVS